MGLIASLDIGAEKTVMALARQENKGRCSLLGIRLHATRGMERGRIADAEKLGIGLAELFGELADNRQVDVLNVGLSADIFTISEVKVVVNIRRKTVDPVDIYNAEQRCREKLAGSKDEVVDILPVAYSVDRENEDLVADPIGITGKYLFAVFQVYKAPRETLEVLRGCFDRLAVGEIAFYPVVRAYTEAACVKPRDSFALVDLGAMGINVLLFRDGLLEYDDRLPLGVRSVDKDIMVAFGINSSQARKLKNELGQAMRCLCKNRKLPIPDSNLTLESRDLATVIQSRTEELLEGVICLLRKWGFNSTKYPIYLTGGGSRMKNLGTLLERMSGHEVRQLAVGNVNTSEENLLHTPEYTVALGLLGCESQEEEDHGNGLGGRLGDLFKTLFG